jgi:hypothetical protein
MNPLFLKILPFLVCFSVLLPVISSVQAQSNSTIENNKIEESKTDISETVRRELSIKKPDKETDVFVITGPSNRVDSAASLATIIYIIGVNKQAVNSAIEFVLAGADPESVGNLMLAIHGLLPKNQSANITKFDQALESYNKIIDLADEDTLQSLENNSAFVTIGQLLKEMRKALP